MLDCVIKLIAEVNVQDENGVYRDVGSYMTDGSGAIVRDEQGKPIVIGDIVRTVFAQVHSVSRSEYYNAGRNGLNPEYYFTMFAFDYKGERTLEYMGSRYGIYRTYLVPGTDYIELYAERKGGALPEDRSEWEQNSTSK